MLGNSVRALVSRKLELDKVTPLKRVIFTNSTISFDGLHIGSKCLMKSLSHFFLIHKQASSPSLQANFKGKSAGRENKGK